MRHRHAEAGRIESDGVQTSGELWREHGFDAGERGFRRADRLDATLGLNEARAEHKSRELLRGEHKRGEIELAAKRVADAGFAFDRLTGELEVADVTIDGALGDLEPLGE